MPTGRARSASTTVNWPTGIGGKGNEGVAAYVKQVNGGIGYVEYAYALQNKLSFTRMKNAAGNWVQPRASTFSAAAGTAAGIRHRTSTSS